MKIKSIYFLFCFFIFPNSINAQKPFYIPKKVKRILFLGNSITYSGKYVAYFEAYLTAKHPKTQYEIINVGLPSETVSGLSEVNHADGRFPRPALQERLSRVLAQTKPDLVFACYGMNDGIYLPLDSARFQKFKEGINWLHDEITKINVPIVHLTPPIFDEKKGITYAKVLDVYSEWLLSQQTNKWYVADIHSSMKKYQEKKRQLDSTFALAADGVHPGELGHWIMAKALLNYVGEKELKENTESKIAFTNLKYGENIFKLVEERQLFMKDAWLTATGHKRPEMAVGIPIEEAKRKANLIEKKIRILLKK